MRKRRKFSGPAGYPNEDGEREEIEYSILYSPLKFTTPSSIHGPRWPLLQGHILHLHIMAKSLLARHRSSLQICFRVVFLTFKNISIFLIKRAPAALSSS